MTHPIGYFTSCEQGQNLVKRFGDHDLSDLCQIDQTALVVTLGGFMMANLAGVTVSLEEAAEACIPTAYDYTTDEVQEAIAILDGLNPDDAVSIIQFLVQ
jgi:hypothetical protein